MTFLDWLFGRIESNPHVNGEWGALHITVLVLIVAFVVASSLILKNKDNKTKYTVLWALGVTLIIFGLTRRVVNFIKMEEYTLHNVLSTLLPRPGCAISCWLVIIALIVNKKFFYNFASMISFLCGLIFFAYPGAGFNNEILMFENVYSIVTHAVFFTMCICFITYGFTEFDYKNIYKEGICLAVLMIYVVLEMFVLKIEGDPFYFMPGNDVADILGMPQKLYAVLYVVFLSVYFNLFYLITKFAKKNKA